MDLRQYTVKEFAEVINENTDVVLKLMQDNSHVGYTNSPYKNVEAAVQNSNVKDVNKEIVTKFIYTNLFNRPEHRFYTGNKR